MTIIGTVLAVLAVLTFVLCALADPVLLSRINGEPAEGDSGRYISVRPEPVPARRLAPADCLADFPAGANDGRLAA